MGGDRGRMRSRGRGPRDGIGVLVRGRDWLLSSLRQARMRPEGGEPRKGLSERHLHIRLRPASKTRGNTFLLFKPPRLCYSIMAAEPTSHIPKIKNAFMEHMLRARRCAKCFTHVRSFTPHTCGLDTFVPFDIGGHLSTELVTSCSRSHSQPGQKPSMAEGRLLEQAAGAASVWAIPCQPPGWSREGCAGLRDASVM